MKVAVVGAGSLIAKALRRTQGTTGWRFVHFAAAMAEPAALRDVDLLINCAFDPRLKTGAYDAACDADLQLAQRLPSHTRVVMLSSRLAYGPAGDEPCLHESRAPRPDRPYGINKLRTEKALAALLGARLTVLRLSNVFGDEDQPGRQNFLAVALRSLRDQRRVVLDMSPFVERDFIPVDALAEHIVQISRAPQAGLYNIGAGAAVPTGRIAQWLIEGHGHGEMVVTDMREFDAFWLDIAAARRDFGIGPVPVQRIRQACLDLGRRARETQDALLSKVAA
ncbi:MAG TPA: NAD-dependent epimerase/dehydratase family protein [Ramlibacter sp.]|nr:NAD-dependent epimerase/dehydratase family protein [Ramlibacter sp.]